MKQDFDKKAAEPPSEFSNKGTITVRCNNAEGKAFQRAILEVSYKYHISLEDAFGMVAQKVIDELYGKELAESLLKRERRRAGDTQDEDAPFHFRDAYEHLILT